MSSPDHTPLTSQQREQRRRLLFALASTTALAACGGGGGDPGTVPGPPPTGPAPAVDGPAWFGFGRDAQHAAQSGVATQDLNRIAWRTPVDLVPPYTTGGALLAHYGSPVVTSHNTVLVPVKTTTAGNFRIEARSGGNGFLIWQADSDYLLPPVFRWVPSWNLALNANNRVYAPGIGGRLMARDNADVAGVAVQSMVFYGAANYAAAPTTFNNTVYIHTPLTVDAAGNIYFGFIVTGTNPAGLSSGLARISAAGIGSWVGAAAAAGDSAIAKVAMNSAPALSPDGATLYVAVNIPTGGGTQRGYLLALDSTTLATKAKVALIDPALGTPARISDDGTSSPTVGPDGDVYFGVLESSFSTHNGRGWLLHFDATLASARTPGSFGWDNTPSIVPRAMVPSYTGGSNYLLMVKYNNYEGTGSGDGRNRIAILDPNATQVDAYTDPSSPPLLVMREVLTILGPTAEAPGSAAVKEWCINTAAVDPLTKSVLANSEDGWLYRWDLSTNRFTQKIQLTSGIGEAYTPTAIGADGAVYAVNNAVLFSIAK